MEIANETLPKSIEAKEFSALFCRDRHASGTHIVFEWMFRKKRSTGSNKRSGYHPKSVCIGRGTIFNSLCESSVGVFYGDAAELDGGNCITFYHKPTHDNGEGGILFFIDCYPGEWSEDNPPVIAGHSVVVAQTEKDTYLLRTPSDVEYSASDPMLAEAYQSLIAQQDLIISHIYATGQTVIPPNE